MQLPNVGGSLAQGAGGRWPYLLALRVGVLLRLGQLDRDAVGREQASRARRSNGMLASLAAVEGAVASGPVGRERRGDPDDAGDGGGHWRTGETMAEALASTDRPYL